jgi:hypothetical protein
MRVKIGPLGEGDRINCWVMEAPQYRNNTDCGVVYNDVSEQPPISLYSTQAPRALRRRREPC